VYQRLLSIIALAVLLTAAPARAMAQDTPQRPEMPRVVLSKQHQALCRVNVGDTMPEIELPRLNGEDGRASVTDLSGETATVVVFWSANRRMALEQLADMGPDVVTPYAGQGVAVVGIAVEESADSAHAALQNANATFPNLLDADGRAFARIGSKKLPRTYLLDRGGTIRWFDLEYSHATRRELRQALRAAVGDPASAGERRRSSRAKR
jgi:peroxiredoxin